METGGCTAVILGSGRRWSSAGAPDTGGQGTIPFGFDKRKRIPQARMVSRLSGREVVRLDKIVEFDSLGLDGIDRFGLDGSRMEESRRKQDSE